VSVRLMPHVERAMPRRRSDSATHRISARLRRALSARTAPLHTLAPALGTSTSHLSELAAGRRFGIRSMPLVQQIAEAHGFTLEQGIARVRHE
jgi:hypothetical protein